MLVSVRWHVWLLPSYALGMIYAAQWKHAMDKDIPNFDELLEKGELLPIREWLTDKVHQYGALKKPFELLKEATGRLKCEVPSRLSTRKIYETLSIIK